MPHQQPADDLGREIRFCPRRRPGMVIAIVSTILGLLTLVLLIGISDAESTKQGDLTFVAILMSTFLGIGALLLALRYRTLNKRISVRVFEHGVVRSSGIVREQILFADAAKLDFGRKEHTFCTWIHAQHGAVIRIDPDELENVDNTLASFIKKRVDAPGERLPPLAAHPGSGQVIFQAGSESKPPLLGPGTIEVMGEGVRMMGAKARTTLPLLIACAVGVIGVVFAAIAMTAMDMKLEGRGSGKLALLIGLAAGVGPGYLVHDQLRKRMRSRRVDVVVPWSGLLLTKHRPGGVGASVTTQDLRGAMEIVAQNEEAAATLDQLSRVGSHAEYGFSA